MTGAPTLRIGTRGSALALAQAQKVAERIPGAELVPISSEGDRTDAPLTDIGGTGVFAGALRRALRAGEVDVLVHSLKDLPTGEAEGIELAAVPRRADARDAVCSRERIRLADLPPGARVGTGSPRRQAQLRAARADLEVIDIRGNVDTRLGRLAADDDARRLDAVILASAGLERMNRLDDVAELLDLSTWPTAPGQGALALETRAGESGPVRSLDHRASRLAVEAERGVLAALEAGCSSPIGAHASLDDGLLFLSARVYAPDGSTWVTASHALYPEDARDPAREVAARVAEELVSEGALQLGSTESGS